MKKALIAFAALSLLLSGCKKDETTPGTTTTPANNSSFTWTAGSGSKVTADSANYYSSITTIYAFKNGASNSIEINLSSLAVGAYSISSATGNALTFVTSSTTYTAHSGNVNITTSNGTRLSGTFSASLSGGTLTSISGDFTNIPAR